MEGAGMTRSIDRGRHELATGAVLRDVVLARETRSLARPLREPVMRIAVPPVREAEGVDDAHLRATQAAQEEGRSHGHAEGLRTGQAQGREEGLQQGLQEGRRQGHAEGLEQGRAEGLEQGRAAGREEAAREEALLRQALAERVQRLDALLAAVPAQVEARLAQGEPEMMALCFEALVQVLGHAGAEGARAMVRQALAQAGARGNVTVRVHPRDFAAMHDGSPPLAPSDGTLQWVADERVQLGGCVIASPEGGLDARLETQLTRLAALLTGAVAEGAAP
jgi:flagellar assembly protein FliH